MIYEREDFACKCGCGVNYIMPEVIDLCNEIFKETGRYFNVNSGFRCKLHPESVKNPTSSHMLGLAVDLAVEDIEGRYLLIRALMDLGVKRIGYYDTFIHLDLDKVKKQDIIW